MKSSDTIKNSNIELFRCEFGCCCWNILNMVSAWESIKECNWSYDNKEQHECKIDIYIQK